MTTAPDLPLPTAAVPATAPLLSLVPDQPAYDAIELDEALRRAQPRLKRYAARRLHDEHEAEEVVQEALLRAFQHRHLLATEDDLNAWATVVTGRLVIDRLRVRGRATPVAEVDPTSRAARDTADVVVARDEARLALDALESMPGRQASVLWAREVEGLSYDEIGERFGMSEPSVRSLLHRARRTLRREYAARGGTLPAVGLIALAPWLHGMRAAGRLRHVARRTATAAAVSATGLAVVSAAPFSAPLSPTHSHPLTQPALRIKATSQHLPAHLRQRHAAPPAATTVVHPASVPAAAGPGPSTRIVGLPTIGDCGRSQPHGVNAGCDTHTSPTVKLSLPLSVAGHDGIGISDDNGVICRRIPTTALTKCDTGSTPSKGTS